ncbi:amidase domain-containing protein [Streptomyces sp. Isolate_45]|uniref:amidase domain-containing protein n=1 Tax=Streptomyces sp. Isolate_45 TaxID=2950111 RepID=UPI0024820D84|nr:amidase domain-containing protein [Streptomyces sp. Isolate_45]MDA5281213.1 amidase domain-containing protein [Streptomyces sp. Isolate_45]
MGAITGLSQGAQAADGPADSVLLLDAGRVHLQNRADLVTTAPQTARGVRTAVAMTAPMAQESQQEAAALADRGATLKAVNGGYTSASVTVTADKVLVDGNRAVVDLVEDTKLYFPDVVPGEPEYEEYSLPHTLTYTRDAATGTWLLSKDSPVLDPNGPAPTTQLTQPAPVPFKEPPFKPNPGEQGPNPPEVQPAEGVKAGRSGTVKGADSGSAPKALQPSAAAGAAPMAAASYSYSSMVNYANRYWKNWNGNYRSYSSDCTNFISQAMRAGGWGTTSGSASSRSDNRKWFYGSFSWTTSYTWAGAENWYWFASRHSGRTYMLSNVWYMQNADVLQADWNRDNTIDHTMIVTAVGGNGERYLTYHSGSTHNRKLSSLVASYPSAWWYAHRT